MAEKKTLYNDTQKLIESLFFKLNDRKCAFLYAGIIPPKDGNDYYMLGTTSDKDFRKNDPEFSIYILRITDDTLKTMIREFFKNLTLDLEKPIVVNMKDISALLNKVKWDLSKIKLTINHNTGYMDNGVLQKECIQFYTYHCTNLRLEDLFNNYVKIFNPVENDIVLNKIEHSSFIKSDIDYVNLNHEGMIKRLPILAGLDNLNIKEIPSDDITFAGFICWKTSSNSMYTGYLCETRKFQSFITRSDIVVF